MSSNKKTINAIFDNPKEKEAIDEWLRKPNYSAGTSKAKMVMELAKKRKNSSRNPDVLIVPVQSIQSHVAEIVTGYREEEQTIIVRGDAAVIAKERAGVRMTGKGYRKRVRRGKVDLEQEEKIYESD